MPDREKPISPFSAGNRIVLIAHFLIASVSDADSAGCLAQFTGCLLGLLAKVAIGALDVLDASLNGASR